jgi:hypothetical protein
MPVDAGAEHGDAASRLLQRSAMRGRVHAEREAAHDAVADPGKGAREFMRVLLAVRRAVAAADDGDGRRLQQLHAPFHVQLPRRPVDFAKAGRKALVAGGEADDRRVGHGELWAGESPLNGARARSADARATKKGPKPLFAVAMLRVRGSG